MTKKNVKLIMRRLRAALVAPRFQIQRTVVAEGELEYCHDPIFLISMHRSGSTLLRRILNAHPSIACPPETHFLTHFMDFMETIPSRNGIAALVGTEAVEDTIRRLAFRYHEFFRLAESKRCWADKTPQYLDRLDTLRQLAPKDSRFVLLLRDPLDVAASIINRGWYINKDAPDIFENTTIYLEKRLPILLGAIHKGVGHVLRYEDYTRTPEPELRAMFDALGESWSDTVLEPWKAQQNFGSEDPTARGLHAFSPNIGTWQDLDHKKMDRLRERIADLRLQLGYT